MYAIVSKLHWDKILSPVKLVSSVSHNRIKKGIIKKRLKKQNLRANIKRVSTM